VIAALTLLPLPAPPLAIDGGDKVYHFIAFAGLMLPVATLRPKALVWMIPAALLFGASIEVLQPFVNRSRDLADFFADAAGVLAGSALGAALNRFS
jgi:VanZ family protein